MSKQQRADWLLVLVTAFWGSTYYLTDQCLLEMTPMCLNATRFMVAFAVLGAIFCKNLIKINRITLKYALIIGVFLTGTYVFYNYGITRTSLTNASFVCALPAVFTPLLDFIIRRRLPGKKVSVCLVICVVGLALMTLNERFRPALGDVFCTCTALCYSFDLLMTEKAVATEGVDPLALGVAELGVVGVLTTVMSLLIERPPMMPQSPRVWAFALFLGVFCTGVAFVIQTAQQKYTTATHVGLIFTLEPVFSSLVAFFIAHEVLSLRGYIGGMLMLLSLVLMEVDISTLGKKESISQKK